MSGENETDAWLQRVLGVSFDKTVRDPAQRRVRFEENAEVIEIPKFSSNKIIIGSGKPRSGITIIPAVPPISRKVISKGGKELRIARRPDGRVVYTAPAAPIREITFSGGGGKGTALVGAVKALHQSGVLETTTKIAGASVGSMTAALVAAGMTPEDFEKIADDANITDQIKEGKDPKLALIRYIATKTEGSSMTGKGLEDAVRAVADESLRKNITKYVKDCTAKNVMADPDVLDIMDKLASKKSGPTFRDYRVLSKVVPGIKEVVITGTYMVGRTADGAKLDADKGQLYIFDADSEPDMEVALAVHASASFPGAFKPIDIQLSMGLTVTFIDGGVMNNTPTSSSLGRERELDPMPLERGVTFVFEDEDGAAEAMKKGHAAPSRGVMPRFQDAWILGGANNAGAEYGKNRAAADKPSEIVVVPLTGEVVRRDKRGNDKVKRVDMRGNFNGTLNFEPKMDERRELRAKTEKATREQIEADKKPKTREFLSESQMFVSIPMDELEALAEQNVPNADKAHLFRQRVKEKIDQLQALASLRPEAPTKLKPGEEKSLKEAAAYAQKVEDHRAAAKKWADEVKSGLKDLDDLAGGDEDFQGYVARELNKKPQLDTLLEADRATNKERSATMKASDAVAETLRVRSVTDQLLKGIVYPKMKMEKPNSAGIMTLLTVEQLLRTARSADQVNQAIQIGHDHFRKKSDKLPPKRGHKEFAKQLERWKMTAH